MRKEMETAISEVWQQYKKSFLLTLIILLADFLIKDIGDFMCCFELWVLIASYAIETKGLFKTKPQEISQKETEISNKKDCDNIEEMIRKIESLLVMACKKGLEDDVCFSLRQTKSMLETVKTITGEQKINNDKMQKLCDYILPLLNEVLQNFASIINNPLKAKEQETKKLLIKSLEIVNHAIEKVSANNLESDLTMMKVNSQTLENMAKMYGLSRNEW